MRKLGVEVGLLRILGVGVGLLRMLGVGVGVESQTIRLRNPAYLNRLCKSGEFYCQNDHNLGYAIILTMFHLPPYTFKNYE